MSKLWSETVSDIIENNIEGLELMRKFVEAVEERDAALGPTDSTPKLTIISEKIEPILWSLKRLAAKLRHFQVPENQDVVRHKLHSQCERNDREASNAAEETVQHLQADMLLHFRKEVEFKASLIDELVHDMPQANARAAMIAWKSNPFCGTVEALSSRLMHYGQT